MTEQIAIEARQLAEQLHKNYQIIKTIVFCNNCESSSDCYMYSVFSMIGLKTGYCAAGIAKNSKEDTDSLSLIEDLSNPDLVNQDLILKAKFKLREQKRILKHYTYCKDCENCGCCDAEDTMIQKNINNRYCGVGSAKAR